MHVFITTIKGAIMSIRRTAGLLAVPLFAAALLTGCSSSNSLSDEEACKEVQSAIEGAGVDMSAEFDPNTMGKVAAVAPEIQSIAERTQSEFSTDLSNVAEALTTVGEIMGEDGQPDMAKLMELGSDPEFAAKIGTSFDRMDEVCGTTLQ